MAEVFFLSCGELVFPGFAVRPLGETRGACRLSVTVAVMIHDGGDITLVDAGFSSRTCETPFRSIGPYAAILGRGSQPGAAIVKQLSRLGLSASSVKTIIATHLHLDHIGGAIDFPNAEVICSLREWQHADHKMPPLGYLRRHLDAARMVPVAIDRGPCLGFPRSNDLHGDGSVVLLDARGHTPGHMAVSLRAGGAHFVHTGDAAYLAWEYRGQGLSLQARLQTRNPEELKRTHAYLRECEASQSRPTLVPAHDPDVFATLPKTPIGR